MKKNKFEILFFLLFKAEKENVNEYLYSMFNNALGLGVEDKDKESSAGSDISDGIENNIIYFDFETTG